MAPLLPLPFPSEAGKHSQPLTLWWDFRPAPWLQHLTGAALLPRC